MRASSSAGSGPASASRRCSSSSARTPPSRSWCSSGIAGFERGDAATGERAAFHAGHLELFRNYDEHGGRLPKPRTLLIDSRQLEAGEALDKGFKDAASAEIEQFKRELAAREGAGAIKGEVNESDLLREVMNTVGRPGRLGEQIRCVVSVSMLTEGWDTNTVTHILGVRAFGTQLLCEQVVGRGLRRQSYELNKDGLFDVEYADIMGIPFDFARSPQKVDPKPPKPVTRVHAIAERADLEIRFPRVSGYRRELPSERLNAEFGEDSRLVITPEDIGPTSVTMEGIVGAGVTITPEVLAQLRPSEISFNLAKHLLYTHFRDGEGFPKQHLFPQIQRLARRWIDEGYLVTKGVPIGAILYQEQLARAAEKIDIACTRGGGGHVVAVLDPYNPSGSTRHVNFITTKECWKTGAQPPRSQISHVVKDSSWEIALAQALEEHPRVLAYAKNQALGFEIPYLDGGAMRRYLPDFLVRLDTVAEPLNLVLEMKGQRDESDKAKAQTARDMWVPGVNALGGYGRWAFAEFTDPYTTAGEFKALVKTLIDGGAAVTDARKLLWVKFGWSDYYRGGLIDGNFPFIQDGEQGHEAWNFLRQNDGSYYCYTPPQGRDGSTPSSQEPTGWTVACLAKDPKRKGVHLIGWYEDAVLEGGYLVRPKGFDPGMSRPADEFYYSIRAQKAFLVPPEDRTEPFSHTSIRQGKYSFLAGPGVDVTENKEEVRALIEGRLRRYASVAVRNPDAGSAPGPRQ